MEPISTVGAVTAVTHAVSLLRGTVDLVKASGKAEVVDKLIELQVAMLDVLQEQTNLVLANRELRDRVDELERRGATKAGLEFQHNAYWSTRDDGGLDGPFTSIVWDTDSTLIRMHFVELDDEGYRFYCPKTKGGVVVPVEFFIERKVPSPDYE